MKWNLSTPPRAALLIVGVMAVIVFAFAVSNDPRDFKHSGLKGAFYGSPEFASVTSGYARTKESAEKLLYAYLDEHLKAYPGDPDYVYFPYPIVYAYDGGYLFVVGEAKVNIQMEGYYVDKDGRVAYRNLKKSLSTEDYNGTREETRPRHWPRPPAPFPSPPAQGP